MDHRRSTSLLDRESTEPARWDRFARAAGPLVSRVPSHRLAELDATVACERSKLRFVGELPRCSRAVEQSNLLVRNVQRMAEHRSQRRDASAAGDEDEALLFGVRGKGEPSDRAIDVDERAGLECQMRSRLAFGVDPDQQFQPSVPFRVFRRARNRVGPPAFVPVPGDVERLARRIRESSALQIDSHDARPRRRRQNIVDGQRQKHAVLCYLTEMTWLRRARGAMLRLVRRRRASTVVGLSLILAAAWVQTRGRFDAWWVEGSSLVAGAIGVALLWTGIFGLKPDWEE